MIARLSGLRQLTSRSSLSRSFTTYPPINHQERDKRKGFLDVTGMSPAVFIEFYRVFSVFSFQCHRHVTKIQLAVSQKFVNLASFREKFLIAGFPLR